VTIASTIVAIAGSQNSRRAISLPTARPSPAPASAGTHHYNRIANPPPMMVSSWRRPADEQRDVTGQQQPDRHEGCELFGGL
jgi:hypothetical protein